MDELAKIFCESRRFDMFFTIVFVRCLSHGTIEYRVRKVQSSWSEKPKED